MIALLDVNVLVALFDGCHIHHDTAHAWFSGNRDHGWAICPLTENGLTRIVTHANYPGNGSTVEDVLARLRELREAGHHSTKTNHRRIPACSGRPERRQTRDFRPIDIQKISGWSVSDRSHRYRMNPAAWNVAR